MRNWVLQTTTTWPTSAHTWYGRPLLRHLFWSWSPRGAGCIPAPPPAPSPPQEPVWRFYFPRKRGMTVTSAKAIGTMSGARNVDVGQGRAAAALEVTFLFLGREASLILIQASSGGRRARQTSRGARSPWVLGASSALGATEGSAEWSPPAVTP